MARPISSEEATVVRWLLDHRGPAEPEVFPDPGVDDLIVVASCRCGCRSVDFASDRTGERIIRDACAQFAYDAQVGIVLWATGNILTALEFHGGTADAAARVPTVSELRTWEQLGETYAQ